MFFPRVIFVAILLSSGCVGRTIKEDLTCEIVPPSTAEILTRSFAPALDSFVSTIPFSSFEKKDRGYCGYYCPGLGVGIATDHIGRVEFETTLVHEVLHAVHFHGLIDKERFADVLARLSKDPDYPNFVSDAPAIGWRRIVYFLFEQSEYFALVGEEIVRRRGIDIPPYLWDIYRNILHPRIEENGQVYSKNPFPEYAKVQVNGTILPSERLLKYALELREVGDNILPLTGVTGFEVLLNLHAETSAEEALTVQFRRRSNGQVLTICSGNYLARAKAPRMRCFWDTNQARLILTTWLEHDLAIEVLDPVVAQHNRR
jgi:hypothetical protein